jgi:glycerol kinase
MKRFVLALDQGTTSSRALLIDAEGRVAATAQEELPQSFPKPGYVEHDPDRIFETQLSCARRAISESGTKTEEIAAIGITNQRETAIVWERATGRPIHPAIVWQCRRTSEACEAIKRRRLEATIRKKTGLVVDPYFSATKIAWILDAVPGARRRAERGELAFGTVDTWLLWRLTGGRIHATDASNASRTSLYDLRKGRFDPELLKIFGVPKAVLPDVVDSSGVVAETDSEWLGLPVPIAGVAGDQQAALFGQACFRKGSMKATYGTGAFLLQNVGTKAAGSKHGLLSTVAWRKNGETTYALEGSVFVAGAAIQWLRDALRVVTSAAASEALAASLQSNDGVYFVPAFTGLGTPHWDAGARGLICGLTRGTGAAHVARAALESIAYQTCDLVDAMTADSGTRPKELRVDGGAARNAFLMQFQADVLGIPVVRAAVTETTALGAAFLAGLAVGFFKGERPLSAAWKSDATFEPKASRADRERLLEGWRDAVSRTLLRKADPPRRRRKGGAS